MTEIGSGFSFANLDTLTGSGIFGYTSYIDEELLDIMDGNEAGWVGRVDWVYCSAIRLRMCILFLVNCFLKW